MNKNLLMSKMYAAGYNQRTLAKALNIGIGSLNEKINGKRIFDINEVFNICELCSITDDSEKILIFLSKSSQKQDDKESA